MEFWNSMLTEKSWDLLKELGKKPFQFVVIGGWGTYLWTKQHKSKDIDIIISDFKDLEYLKQNYDLKKNDFLHKYEIQFGDIDLDIYVVHYSKLTLPITEITKHASWVESIKVASPEILLILKQGAEADRESSVKGRKDRIDIVTLLLFSEIDFELYKRLLKKYKLNNFIDRLKKIIKEFTDFKYLGLNPREFKLKKKGLLKRVF